ncbi:MAG: hypothetical protein U9R13_03525, partial [Campylobacterota bacterium]|nr:hypothetical protein [Campylobacterota bacterium]
MYKKITTFIKMFVVATIGLVGLSSPVLSEEDHHDHKMHEWELGVSMGYANLKTEDEEGVNLHLHLLKRLEGDGIQKYF